MKTREQNHIGYLRQVASGWRKKWKDQWYKKNREKVKIYNKWYYKNRRKVIHKNPVV